MDGQRLIVISDTHISADPLDDFDNTLEAQLCRFLAMQAAGPLPVELVINGDFLDFVQAPPWEGKALSSTTADKKVYLCFTQEQSLAKLEAIIRQHGALFDALGQFLAAKPANRLTILPGNHDADFFWPNVHTRLTERIGQEDAGIRARVYFHLEQVYRSLVRPSLWIEHGHQYDCCNQFIVDGMARWSAASPPIYADRNGVDRLLECVGTRFLLRYLNRLDYSYPYVDNVKPLSRFVKLAGLSALFPDQGPFRVVVAIWGLMRFLVGTAFFRFSDILTLPAKLMDRDELAGQENVLSILLEKMTEDQREAFAGELRVAGLKASAPLLALAGEPEGRAALMDTLMENPELIDRLPETDIADDLLSLEADTDELSLVGGFTVDESREMKKAARAALAHPGIEDVVMGHTHESVDFSDQLRYANTGCWTRYYRFAAKESSLRWPLLRKPTYSLFPYRLLYVEATADSRPRLELFHERTS